MQANDPPLSDAIQDYLREVFKLEFEGVHAEADRLEHSLSAELERRIDAALGHPTHDPHGHPIPDARLNLAEQQTRTCSTSDRARRERSASYPTRTTTCSATWRASTSCPGAPSPCSASRPSTAR